MRIEVLTKITIERDEVYTLKTICECARIALNSTEYRNSLCNTFSKVEINRATEMMQKIFDGEPTE